MTSGAHVGSLEAVRDFRAAVHCFDQAAREALDAYEIELRRARQWLSDTRPQYWNLRLGKCDEAILEAKRDLDRCRLSRLPGGEPPACSEQKKALERARRRREEAEEKLAATRKWHGAIEHESREYVGLANRLQTLLDADLPRAAATLNRVLDALEAYRALQSPSGPSPLHSISTSQEKLAARPPASQSVRAESDPGAAPAQRDLRQ